MPVNEFACRTHGRKVFLLLLHHQLNKQWSEKVKISRTEQRRNWKNNLCRIYNEIECHLRIIADWKGNFVEFSVIVISCTVISVGFLCRFTSLSTVMHCESFWQLWSCSSFPRLSISPFFFLFVPSKPCGWIMEIRWNACTSTTTTTNWDGLVKNNDHALANYKIWDIHIRPTTTTTKKDTRFRSNFFRIILFSSSSFSVEWPKRIKKSNNK